MDSVYNHAANLLELTPHECGFDESAFSAERMVRGKTYFYVNYIFEGTGELTVRDHKHFLGKGSLFIYVPNSNIKFRPLSPQYRGIWISFSGSVAEKLIYDLRFDTKHPFYSDNSFYLAHYFQRTWNIYQEAGYLDLRCLGILYFIFGFLFDQRREVSGELDETNRNLVYVKNYIAENYYQKITVSDMAASIGNTTYYVAAIFKKLEGVSPKKYLTKYRMEKAKFLLVSGHYKVKQIAEMVGYEDQLHFSTEFRKNVGMSPVQFMRSAEPD